MQEPASEQSRQALRDLEALKRERDLFRGLWSGWFTRDADKLSTTDKDTGDPIELWGRRIGRTLAAFAFIGFCIYLYFTYVH